MREDPFEGDISLPPSLHRYQYALSNPTIYVDPNGECLGPLIFLCAAAAGAAINVGADLVGQLLFGPEGEPIDGGSLAISAVTGAFSGAAGAGVFVSGARAGFAFAGALTADSVIDTFGDGALADDPGSFRFADEFARNAAFNLVGGALVERFAKGLNKAADSAAQRKLGGQLNSARDQVRKLFKEKAILSRNARLTLNAPDILRAPARKLGVSLQKRAGKTRLTLVFARASEENLEHRFSDLVASSKFLFIQAGAELSDDIVQGVSNGAQSVSLEFSVPDNNSLVISVETANDALFSDENNMKMLIDELDQVVDFQIATLDDFTNDVVTLVNEASESQDFEGSASITTHDGSLENKPVIEDAEISIIRESDSTAGICSEEPDNDESCN